MPPDDAPAYDLLQVQYLVRMRCYKITAEVTRTIGRDGFEEEDVVECILALTPANFYKATRSDRNPDEMLDVYKAVHRHQRVYVKFKVLKHGESVFVLSFKGDESR